MDSESKKSFIKFSEFKSETGACETFVIIHSDPHLNFKASLEKIYKNYLDFLKQQGLSSSTQIFSRIYVSDIANQKAVLMQSELLKFIQSGAYAVVEQMPLDSGNISLFTYHLKTNHDELAKKSFPLDDEKWRNALLVKGTHYDLLWTGNFSGYGTLNSYNQTDEIFSAYNYFINSHGMTLLNHTIRTWLYVRDIDNHYQGMVDSRLEYFEQQGLTAHTRYIASTGIEARLKDVYTLVSMDALSIANLTKNQIIRLEAPRHLNPTIEYGVTFERGTKVAFRDREHFYISGTASIDHEGKVLFEGDVEKQTFRALENIQALLKPHQADIKDMTYFYVYLRNIKDFKLAEKAFYQVISNDIPVLFVHGAVCRPTWLVEIEGVGVKKAVHNALFDYF